MGWVPESRNLRAVLKHRLEEKRAELLADRDTLRRKAKHYLETGCFDESPHKHFVEDMVKLLHNLRGATEFLNDKQASALAGCVAFIDLKSEESKKS